WPERPCDTAGTMGCHRFAGGLCRHGRLLAGHGPGMWHRILQRALRRRGDATDCDRSDGQSRRSAGRPVWRSVRAEMKRPVQLSFLDPDGHMLAEARGVPPSGAIYVTSPLHCACHDVEERAAFSADAMRQWDECFERQSRWLPTWI